MTWYPRTNSSPDTPRATTVPVDGSTILHSTCGKGRPTVDARFSSGSFTVVIVETGDVSVIPYPITKSRMPIRAWTCFITSIGHGEPPMKPRSCKYLWKLDYLPRGNRGLG